MNIRSFAAALTFMFAASTASATIVNVDSTGPAGTTVFLSAGTYSVSFIGTSGGGAYDAWKPFGDNNWTEALGIASSDFPGGGSYYSTAISYFSSPADALLAYQTSDLYQTLLTNDITDPSGYFPAPNPITFTLAAAANVKFYIVDSFYDDNAGGVSLSLAGDVPEPSTWATMVIGFAGLGYAGYRRSRNATRLALC